MMLHTSIWRRRRWPRAATAASVFLAGLVAAAGVAVAASPAECTVDSDGPAKFWTGNVPQSGATIPSVPECASSPCDDAKIRVKLAAQIWQNKPGGLEISIRWQGGFTDILGL